MKVLIAEDDSFLASAYVAKFAKVGAELRLAKNGQEALDVLRDFVPDVIVLDLIMPVMDGFSALEKIKKDERLRDIPVLVASNLEQQEDRVKAEKIGAAGYIVKSNMSISDLVELVRKMGGAGSGS